MVTRDPVSRRASAGVPSTSMVVVSVGPRTTSSTAAGVGLSPCRVWSKTSFTASSIHCAFPDEGPPPGISEPGTRVATSTRLSCDLLWDGSIVGTLLDVVANPYTNVHGTNVCLLSSSRCILRGGGSMLWGWNQSFWDWCRTFVTKIPDFGLLKSGFHQ